MGSVCVLILQMIIYIDLFESKSLSTLVMVQSVGHNNKEESTLNTLEIILWVHIIYQHYRALEVQEIYDDISSKSYLSFTNT